jgi:DMSO/TMAO reductase YedYZ molybdopterin-dependent catalytic subunit
MKKVFLGVFVITYLLYGTENYVTTHLKFEGLVEKKFDLDIKSLKAYPSITTKEIPIICMSSEVKEQVKSYKGVRLTTLLDDAGIIINSKRDFNKLYVVAKASDGYSVLFSYQELFNTNNGKNVIVFYEKNGKSLGEDEGKIALISIDDIKNGSRHVKWLETIIVKKYTD